MFTVTIVTFGLSFPLYEVIVFCFGQEGFWYHHAEPKYLMLVYWIPQSAHTIPANATHRVGVGVVAMNEKDEVLLPI